MPLRAEPLHVELQRTAMVGNCVFVQAFGGGSAGGGNGETHLGLICQMVEGKQAGTHRDTPSQRPERCVVLVGPWPAGSLCWPRSGPPVSMPREMDLIGLSIQLRRNCLNATIPPLSLRWSGPS